MSKQDKHTPLSTDELVKLLENNSGKATDFDGMDDFEKEALEGFSKFSTPEKAAAMVEEINMAVSKKVALGPDKLGPDTKNEEAGNTKKNRVIWFSAAASVVLLVIVSVFFLKQSKEDTASNVALNDLVPTPTEQPTVVAPDAGVTVEEPMNEKNGETGQGTSHEAVGKKGMKQEVTSRLENEDTKPGTELPKEIAFAETKTLEEAENITVTGNSSSIYKANDETKELIALKKSKLESSDKLDAVKPAATKNQTETTIGYPSSASGSVNSSAPLTTMANTNTKYDDRIVAEKATKDSKAKEKSPASATDSEMDQDIETAYYKGGELAIREYVLAYLQKNSLTVTGKYKIKANVLTNGKLKVKYVDHITREVCKDCETILKKALNEMTGWTPAMWGKTASESSVDFVLSF